MTFEQAIERLIEKLPAEMRFRLERRAGRKLKRSTRTGKCRVRPYDRFRLTIEGWEDFPARRFAGPLRRLDQAVGVAIDEVRTWQSTGETPADCTRCRDTGYVDVEGGKELCDCQIPF